MAGGRLPAAEPHFVGRLFRKEEMAMNRAWWLLTAILGIPAAVTSTAAQAPRSAQLLRITVDAPGAPGATVTLRYLRGPDSL